MLRALLLLGAVAIAISSAACSRPANTQPAMMGGAPNEATHIGPIPGPRMSSPPPQRPNPFENEELARQDGRQLFVRFNCSGCHGGHAGGGMGPSLRDPVWLYGNSPENIFSSIAQGRGKGMPAWGALLPEEQIWKLVSYIRSLGTPDEASPPSPAPGSASPGAAPLVP